MTRFEHVDDRIDLTTPNPNISKSTCIIPLYPYSNSAYFLYWALVGSAYWSTKYYLLVNILHFIWTLEPVETVDVLILALEDQAFDTSWKFFKQLKWWEIRIFLETKHARNSAKYLPASWRNEKLLWRWCTILRYPLNIESEKRETFISSCCLFSSWEIVMISS